MTTSLFRSSFSDRSYLVSALIECSESIAESVATVLASVDGTVSHAGASRPYEYRVDRDAAVAAIISSAACQHDADSVRCRLESCNDALSFAVEMCGAKAYVGDAMYARLLAEQLGQSEEFESDRKDRMRWSDGSVLHLATGWMAKATRDTYYSLPSVEIAVKE